MAKNGGKNAVPYTIAVPRSLTIVDKSINQACAFPRLFVTAFVRECLTRPRAFQKKLCHLIFDVISGASLRNIFIRCLPKAQFAPLIIPRQG